MEISIGPGDKIDGKYVVERLLGRGGMGAVFVALQEELGRRVAIKVLLPGIEQSEEALVRFTREARAAAALQSDHVARVLDVGRLPNGTPYTVMELLEGEDVSALSSRQGCLAVAEAVHIILQACDAIAEAHSLGIVHRDIKPANIFLARRPNGSVTVKVLDFGISKAAGVGASASLTSSLALIGSPLYMSPEQLREARTVDGRADIWALGVTLYELLTGATPFVSGTLAEICSDILTATPRSARSRRPDVPRSLDAIVMRCLEKAPEARFANVQELVAALESISRETVDSGTLSADAFVPPSGWPLPPSGGRALVGTTTSALSSTSEPPVVQRNRRAWALGGVAAIAVLGAVSALGGRILRGHDPPPASSQRALAAMTEVPVAPPSAMANVVPAVPSTSAASPNASSGPPLPTAMPTAKPRVKRPPTAGTNPPTGPSPSSSPSPSPAREVVSPVSPASTESPTANPLDLPFR